MSTLKKKEQLETDMTTDAAVIEKAMEGSEDTAWAGGTASQYVPDPTPAVTTAPKAPDPWEVLQRVAGALESLAQRPSGGTTESKAIEVLTAAVERMAASNVEGAKLITEENRKAHRPSNTVIPNVSVFNRRGTMLGDEYQKPPLKCMMMIPWVAEWESLTREEVELLNLLEAGEYVIRRIDRSKITMTVQIRLASDAKTPSALLISHETAFNNDNFKMMPPLSDWLREALKQHDRPIAARAAAILTDEEEEALIEAGELSVSQ